MPKGIYKRKDAIQILRGKLKWLDSKGGRSFRDLLKDEVGEYVLMGDGYGGDKKVYLPIDFKI